MVRPLARRDRHRHHREGRARLATSRSTPTLRSTGPWCSSGCAPASSAASCSPPLRASSARVPELLVRRRGTGVVSRPMAGTVPVADETGLAHLASSDKLDHEHAVVVDAIRAALAPHCAAAPAVSGPRPVPVGDLAHLVTELRAEPRRARADGARARPDAASHPCGRRHAHCCGARADRRARARRAEVSTPARWGGSTPPATASSPSRCAVRRSTGRGPACTPGAGIVRARSRTRSGRRPRRSSRPCSGP